MFEEKEKENNVEYFLNDKKSKKEKFKLYISMSPGIGKSFRMLQEVHTLVKNNINVKIGFIETHCNGKPQFSLLKSVLSNTIIDRLLIKLTGTDIDLIILS